jgi:hypothetical protein
MMIVTGARRRVVLPAMEKEIEREEQSEPEDQSGAGAEGGRQSPDADAPPGAPSEASDSEVGDTDQHSES